MATRDLESDYRRSAARQARGAEARFENAPFRNRRGDGR